MVDLSQNKGRKAKNQRRHVEKEERVDQGHHHSLGNAMDELMPLGQHLEGLAQRAGGLGGLDEHSVQVGEDVAVFAHGFGQARALGQRLADLQEHAFEVPLAALDHDIEAAQDRHPRIQHDRQVVIGPCQPGSCAHECLLRLFRCPWPAGCLEENPLLSAPAASFSIAGLATDATTTDPVELGNGLRSPEEGLAGPVWRCRAGRRLPAELADPDHDHAHPVDRAVRGVHAQHPRSPVQRGRPGAPAAYRDRAVLPHGHQRHDRRLPGPPAASRSPSWARSSIRWPTSC